MSKLRHLCLALIVLIWLPQPPAAAGDTASIKAKADALVAAQGFPTTQVGYLVFDLSDGNILLEQNADRAYIPASLQKVPTMLYGLDRLGPWHRFSTRLLAQGKITNGKLVGDLYLKGGGDPFLASEDLLELIGQLNAYGVREVVGRFFYDESALPSLTELNPTQPRAVSYNPGLSALNLNFNVLELAWARDPKTGTLAAGAVSRSEATEVTADSVAIAMLPTSRGKAVPYLPSIGPEGESWFLSPELSKKGQARVPVKLAALNAAQIFRKLALMQGISLPVPQAGIAPPGSQPLGEHESVPLVEAVKLILRYSNNLSAEIVALLASMHGQAPVSSLQESGQRIAAWLRQRVPQGDWQGLLLANGSGLSSLSRMTARQMATILFYGYSLHRQGLDVPSLMAKPRWRKTLGKLQKKHGKHLTVRGKSGTIYFSRAYAGYLDTKGGRKVGFALFISDLNQRQVYDQTLNIDQVVAPAGAAGWMKRAKKLEREMVSLWLLSF